MLTFAWILAFFMVLGILAYQRASMAVAAIAYAVLLLFLSFLSHLTAFETVIIWVVFVAIFIPLSVKPIRRQFISRLIMQRALKVAPKMSDTERAALEAGTVGWTGDLFSGMPDWHKFRAIEGATLSAEEQAFLAGPVQQLCEMLDNWKISTSMDVPQQVWDFIKQHGFFGMIIPKQYGGLEFSATMHSEVITKLSSACIAVATIVSVPNSLGPAELLLRYGSEQQKNHYLPRLARGEEIPCFALTSPIAGSDASSITDNGVVFKTVENGQELLKIRLNWNKRYITLSPVATLLGLAFKLYDPEHLLGGQVECGITCALIPVSSKGVVTGRRHFPLHSAFPNGPTQGTDVEIPLDWIIGGEKMAGQGWRMLMECLAAGRSISLPSMVTGGAKKAMLATGAYSRIRRQFNTFIGNFGGIEEALARIAGYAYATEALRLFTVASIDRGEEPVVESAISKCYTTGMSRQILLDAMDVHGGKGICMGPNNYLAQAYIESPISITVEGANILTRSLIIFGQGAIRCHPYVFKEMQALQSDDLKLFDEAIFGHLGFIASNKIRAFILGLTRGHAARIERGPLCRYYQLFSRFSAAFALVADFSMVTLGGKLKRMEKISGRLSDILSYLYIGSAVLKHFQLGNGQGPIIEELPVVKWICQDLLFKIQTQLNDLLRNLPSQFWARCMWAVVFPLGKTLSAPSDELTQLAANTLLHPNAMRERFAQRIYMADKPNNPVGAMSALLEKVIQIEPLEQKLAKAIHKKQVSGKTFAEYLQSAVAAEVLTQAEADSVAAVNEQRMRIINVDDFASPLV